MGMCVISSVCERETESEREREGVCVCVCVCHNARGRARSLAAPSCHLLARVADRLVCNDRYLAQQESERDLVHYANLLAEVAPHDAEALKLASLALATRGEHDRAHELRRAAQEASQQIQDDPSSMPYRFAVYGELGALL